MRKVERIFVHCTANNRVKGYNDTAIAMKIYNSNGWGGVQKQASRAHQQMLRALHPISDGRNPSSHHKGKKEEVE